MTITLALASQPYSTARADARHARRIVNNNHVLSRGQRNARDARVGRRASSVCAAAPEQPFAVDQGDAMDEQTISQEKRSVQQFDFVVVGSGIAGLSFALKAADHGRVAIITKAEMVEGCTQYAQGGVCAVLDTYDSVDAHIHDTMVAGAFLNDARAVEVVCKEGAHRVLELAALGAEFTRNADGTLHLTCEGGHSAKRIVHAADVTGREIERALCAAAEAHPNIHVFEHRLALDLVLGEVEGRTSCLGVDVLHEATQSLCRFVAPVTMLATGGAGHVYPLTTNPHVSTGDGMAMAYRARAAVANMEFVQFHPTALYDPQGTMRDGRAFLISEAVRGEGGRLYNLAGERFMSKYDDRMELATRIHDQLMHHGDTHVLLDISHEHSDKILTHFPNIAARCAAANIDITSQPIPVAPAQHYFCGGVRTGLYGEASIPGLFACGEVASTGLHGANRLASNSLLEGLVFAHRALGPAVAVGELVGRTNSLQHVARVDAIANGRDVAPLMRQTQAWVTARRAELQHLMWQHCGIVRSRHGMKEAFWKMATMYVETKAVCESMGVNTQLQELLNLICVGELVLSSALQRKESRGGHYCVEYPAELEEQRREVIIAQSLPTRTDLAKVVGTKAALPMAVASVRRPRRPRRTTPSGPPSPLPVERPSRELSVRVTRRDQG